MKVVLLLTALAAFAPTAQAQYDPSNLSAVCGELGVPARPDCDDPCGYNATFRRPCAYLIKEIAGDSLKYTLSWRQPSDGGGDVDSTKYNLKATLPFVYYNNSNVFMPGTLSVRRFRTGQLVDSLKSALPAPGDSVDFMLTNFIQCRDGLCSDARSLTWNYKRPALPKIKPSSAAPTVKVDVF